LGLLAEGGTTEGVSRSGAEEFAERRVHYISVRVRVRLVVATGQDLASGGDDTSAPCAPAGFRPTAQVVMAVSALDITAVARVGRHQRVTVLVVVKLGCFEDQTIRPECTVLASESLPFVFVGA